MPDLTFDSPWYIETFAPEPKDIVIIMDATQSGQDAVVKEAVLKIIETTNPNDRVRFVRLTQPIEQIRLSEIWSKQVGANTRNGISP